MNMNRKALRMTACCVAAAITLTGTPIMTYAAVPVAGASSITTAAVSEEGAEDIEGNVTAVASAGVFTMVADAMNTASVNAERISENTAPEVKSEYTDIAIAQVDNCVNVRDAASEEGNVVGKLYNNSAATVTATEGDWYQITSGNVTGYVKSEFVVCGNEELARSVSRRVATVHTETLFVRTEPTTESDVLQMVPDQDELTVIDESIDGWKKVTTEGGEGYVSNDFVSMSTEYVTAESKEEEERRLAKEEAEREAANAAAATKKGSSGKSSGKKAASGSGGSAVVNYASQFVGNPYVYGGTSLTNGADCSGFILSVYAAFGVGLPHSSAAMRGVGYGVDPGDMQPGDIICYSGHVAIYAGNNTVVHASTPETGIKYSSPANYKPILAVRRIF